MLPYGFLAITMKSVGKVALSMVKKDHKQFNTIPSLMEGFTKPYYVVCLKISTNASIKKTTPLGLYSSIILFAIMGSLR